MRFNKGLKQVFNFQEDSSSDGCLFQGRGCVVARVSNVNDNDGGGVLEIKGKSTTVEANADGNVWWVVKEVTRRKEMREK